MHRSHLSHRWNKLLSALLHRRPRARGATRPIRVALLIDEYFGACGTAYGGYGFLARYYVSKYIPTNDIRLDVILGRSNKYYFGHKINVEGVDVYYIPWLNPIIKLWILFKRYDVYFSIELTYHHVLTNTISNHTNLILWIQDPRPRSEWAEISSVSLLHEPSYYNERLYDAVHRWYTKGRVTFISQAKFLNTKAINLYGLKHETPIKYVPNPISDSSEKLDIFSAKDNIVLFLGRIEAIKRCWLFCETARALPSYQFYVLGGFFREAEDNKRILLPYKGLPNLYFVGHTTGAEKLNYLRKAKVLLNTSVHEGLPISFLEALLHGTLPVSSCDPEGLVSKFGRYVGHVPGDGFEGVPRYVEAVREIIENDKKYDLVRADAAGYVRTVHSVDRFTRDVRSAIRDAGR